MIKSEKLEKMKAIHDNNKKRGTVLGAVSSWEEGCRSTSQPFCVKFA